MRTKGVVIALAFGIFGALFFGNAKRSPPTPTAQEVVPFHERDKAMLSAISGMSGEPPVKTAEPPRREAPSEPTPQAEPVQGGLTALRNQNLKRWQRFLRNDALLEGYARKKLVEDVCAPLPTHEERQMCRLRGRRMGEQLEKHFGTGKPFSKEKSDAATSFFMEEARDKSLHPRRDRVSKFTVADGKLVDWVQLKLRKRKMRSGWEAWILQFLMFFGDQIFSPGQNFDFYVDMSDGCISREKLPPHPIITYSNRETCQDITPLNYALWCQGGGSLSRKQKPFDTLEAKIVNVGGCSEAHRLAAPALSASGTVPQLVSRCFEPDHKFQRKCWKLLERVSQNNSDSITRFWDHRKGRLCGSVATNQHTAVDDLLKNKYLLVVDGHGTTFRLAGRLQTNTVVFLWNPTGFRQSFEYDMLPYVHYIPMRPAVYGDLGSELTKAYEWLEANPDIAKSIAEESTRWGQLHADRGAFITEWKLYAALLSDMYEASSAEAYASLAKSAHPIENLEPENPRLNDPNSYFVLRVKEKPIPRVSTKSNLPG